jgi:Flp pilus assembly protein TadD
VARTSGAEADIECDLGNDAGAELDQAGRWARRALELDDSEPFAHMALGHVMLWLRDHDGALAEFRRMLELDPNFAQGFPQRGWC